MTGVNFFLRKIAKVTVPTEYWSINVDGSYDFKMTSTFKNQEFTFKLDTAFKQTRVDGKTVYSVYSLIDEGTTLVEKQYEDSNLDKLLCTVWRHFSVAGTADDGVHALVVRMDCKGVKAVRTFKRLE